MKQEVHCFKSWLIAIPKCCPAATTTTRQYSGHTPNHVRSNCTDCWHSDAEEHNHNDVIADCCHDHFKMRDCCRQHNVPEQFTCYDQLDEDAVERFVQMYCANILDKVPNTLRDRDYELFPDLHLATCGGSYPYQICYMAFTLRQTKNAKFLIRIGADYLESNSKGLPSYLWDYCKVASQTTYLGFLAFFQPRT